MSNITLYGAEENLAAFLETEEGGIPEEMQQEFALALAGASEMALDKRDNCIRFLRHIEAQIEFAKAEKGRINEWQKHLEGGLERFRLYLATVVAEHGKQAKGSPKLEGRIGSLSLRKKPDTALVTDEAEVPAKYKTVTVTMSAEAWAFLSQDVVGFDVQISESISRRPILEALKVGEEIPGAELLFGEDTLLVK